MPKRCEEKCFCSRPEQSNWKKCAAKHECEYLKEGIWLEPALALLSQKTKEDRTEKHRNVARKLVFEGGWVQKRLRMQQEVQVKGDRWAEEIPQRWRQPKGADRTEMRKEAERLRCTLLNGSAWSTERKYMRRYEGKCDIVFGIEYRLSKEEMEEQFKREGKEGWRFAADAARITHETAGSEDRKHTSGGVFIAVYSNLGAVVGEKEGAVASIPGNEGRIAQAWVNVKAWVNVQGSPRVFFRFSSGIRKDGPQETKPFRRRC